MGCIYRIYCAVSGRSYIGQTSFSHPFVRFVEHQRDAEKGTAGALYEDLRLYGVQSFECSCICVVPNTALNNLECYYAEQYSAYAWEGGYNHGECGRAIVRREMDDEKRLWIKRKAIRNNR